MKRERIEEILQQELNVKEDKGWTHYQAPEPDEVIELCRLALRATDPDMVMVPREKLDECLLEAQQVKGQAFATLQSVKSLLAAIQENQP